MTKVKDIVSVIERIAPLRLQEDYDNAGYQVGDPETEVTKVLTCLDVTEATIDQAIACGAQIVVSHHPLLFRPIHRITPADYISRVIIKAISNGIAIYSAHTNLDNAFGGVNYKMAEVLGLNNVKPLAPLPAEKTAGMENASMCGSGIVGTLAEPLPAEAFIAKIKDVFHADNIRTNIDAPVNYQPSIISSKPITKVALCGGSGSEFISNAERCGADAYLTGEIGYHRFFGHDNILLVEAGHYETEQYTCNLLSDIIGNAFPNIEIIK